MGIRCLTLFHVEYGVSVQYFINLIQKEINPSDSLERKQAKLILESDNFSYRKFVSESKKKLMDNCNDEV